MVIAVRFILSEEFVSFGYHKITDDLRNNGFIINAKKTYRLVKEQKLLCDGVFKPTTYKRPFVSFVVQQPDRPMQQLCTDIKYIHIHGQKRNALLLSVLDVYTPSILGKVLWWRIRKENVIWLLHQILQQHQVTCITLSNDNGSQFIAHALREFLQEKQITQEFIHVSRPQENSFIEAYHSIVEREVVQPRQFENIQVAIDIFNRWRLFYNNRRLHDSLDNLTPTQQWNKYLSKTNEEQTSNIFENKINKNSQYGFENLSSL